MSRTPNYNVTGAWLEGDDPGERQFIKIGFLLLENGETLPDITIAYQSWGTLNKDKSNAILINHAMTGWSDVTGWWPQMVGPGLPFDTDKYFIVCPNVIGGCQGSTGPASIAPDGKRYGSRFPIITIRDMVNAEVAFSDALGIEKYALAVGPSLGGCARWNGRCSYLIASAPSALLAHLPLPQEIRLALLQFKFAPLNPTLIFTAVITTKKSADQSKEWASLVASLT